MNLSIAQQIVTAAQDAGWEADVYPDYSGRGMHGRTTAGIIVPDVMTFAAAVGAACQYADDAEGIVEAVKGAQTDDMGRDMIVY